MRNGGTSFWWAQIGVPPRRPQLDGDREADVCIVGAGVTGLWTAYYLKKARPDLDVIVLDKEFAGYGASSRHGGGAAAAAFNSGRAELARTNGRDRVLDLLSALRQTIDEIVEVSEAEGIDADIVKAGAVRVARTPSQVVRLKGEIAHERSWDSGPDVLEELNAEQLAELVRIPGASWGSRLVHCARLHPAKFVRGLAEVVERLGVPIYEGTNVSEVTPGRAITDNGTVRARHIISGLDGYYSSLRGHKRTFVPLLSSMIATEPLSDAAWDEIGWNEPFMMSTADHDYAYLQRTADGRIAIGSTCKPYRFGSRFDDHATVGAQYVARLTKSLHDLFPASRDVPIAHAWSGVFGVPRDWVPVLNYDEKTGIGSAGGYVGSGIGVANLAARTFRDLILGERTDITHLPWVNHTARNWEIEPLRWVGVHATQAVYQVADKLEARSNRPRTSVLAKIADGISGH